MAAQWRSGADRMLERVVISRRTSEQELDLLLLLEGEAPRAKRRGWVPSSLADERFEPMGEASASEIAVAVSEWLATLKDKLSGHDRFQLAVARNALGILQREYYSEYDFQWLGCSDELSADILSGAKTLADKDLLQSLRFAALEKVRADSPKYPAFSAAQKKWLKEE